MFLPSFSPKATGGKAPYLSIRRSVPSFRIRIPVDLQVCLGRTEYRRSLGPCYASEAKFRALRLATAAHEVFAFAREATCARTESLTQRAACGKNNRLPMWSTSNKGKLEESAVRQGNPTMQYWSTTADLKGRSLGSLTDQEIRVIADSILLFALKSSALTAHERYVLLEHNYDKIAPLETGDAEFDAETARLDEKWAREDAERRKTLSTEEYEDYHCQLLSENTRIRKEQYRRALMAGKPDAEIARITDYFLKFLGIQVNSITDNQAALFASPPKASIPYIKAYQEILKAHVTLYDINVRTALGDYVSYDEMVERLEQREEAWRDKRRIKVQNEVGHQSQPAALSAAPSQPTASPLVVTDNGQEMTQGKGIKLSEAIQEMFRSKTLEGSWKPKVQRMEREKFNLFQAVVDPEDKLSIANLGAKHISRYKEIVLQLPARRSLNPAYRDLDTPALLHLIESGGIPVSDRIKTNTIKTYFQSVTALINWAAKHEYHKNPVIADNLEIKADKQPHEYRDPFSDQDIERLFAPDSLIKGTTVRERKRAAISGA